MKQHYFYNIMRTTIIQFLDMINDIQIARYDKDTGDVLKYIKVPLRFSPKTKLFYWEEKMLSDGTRQRDRILPMMAVNLITTEFDSARIVNKHHNLRTAKNEVNSIYKYVNLIPYNYSFELNIAAEYMVDITQILEQILPYFNPTAFVRIAVPELDIKAGEEYEPLDLKVVLESSTAEMLPDMAEDEYRALGWVMTFRVEGYLSQGIQEDKIVKSVVNEFKIGAVEPENAQITTTTTGLSATDYPLDVTTEEATGAYLDTTLQVLYTYERVGD